MQPSLLPRALRAAAAMTLPSCNCYDVRKNAKMASGCLQCLLGVRMILGLRKRGFTWVEARSLASMTPCMMRFCWGCSPAKVSEQALFRSETLQQSTSASAFFEGSAISNGQIIRVLWFHGMTQMDVLRAASVFQHVAWLAWSMWL